MKKNHDNLAEELKEMLRTVLEYEKESGHNFSLEISLYEEGIGLDSLDTAAFSAMLEEKYGADPYSKGQFPRTLHDVIHFYEAILEQ